MNKRKIFLLYVPVISACMALSLMPIAIHGQMEESIRWILLMEFYAPTLILGLALIIYFVHKAPAA